jgi:protein-L-isoaspartate(D-aspartate) O-methyltransferase
LDCPTVSQYCLKFSQKTLYLGCKALDVGVGSGYLAACFAEMVGEKGKVIGIDYLKALVERSEKNLKKDGRLPSTIIELRTGDGWKGLFVCCFCCKN